MIIKYSTTLCPRYYKKTLDQIPSYFLSIITENLIQNLNENLHLGPLKSQINSIDQEKHKYKKTFKKSNQNKRDTPGLKSIENENKEKGL